MLGTDRNSIVLILFSFSEIKNKSTHQTFSMCKNGESEWWMNVLQRVECEFFGKPASLFYYLVMLLCKKAESSHYVHFSQKPALLWDILETVWVEHNSIKK